MNLGRCAGDVHGLRSVLDLLSDSQRWDILLLQEVDNYFVHEHAVFESLAKAVEPHMYVRHWPGAGSVAMAAIIPVSYTHLTLPTILLV